MWLETLTLKNYRLFSELTVTFHENLTVLAGGNGSGKTAVLEGAAVALGTLFTKLDGIAGTSLRRSDTRLKAYALGSSDDVQPQYPMSVTAAGFLDGTEKIQWTRALNTPEGSMTVGGAKKVIEFSQNIQNRLRSGDQTLLLPVIAYYGTSRLRDYHREKRANTRGKNTRTKGYIDCLDGTANIKLMMDWFEKMTLQKYQRQESNLGPVLELDAVTQALGHYFSAVTGYQDVSIQYNLDTRELDVRYVDQRGFQMRIPMSQLSDGYRGTLSLVADIAYRMAILNPQLLDHVLTETEGIVLIDEVDLHLHPQWQKQVLGDLVRIFPKVQFIVSTHAPEVINSVRSENLVILEDAQVKEPGSQVYGKDVKSLLKEVMGVEERPNAVAQRFNQFYEALKQKDFAAAECTLDALDELREYQDPEVAACRVKLRLERLRGGAV